MAPAVQDSLRVVLDSVFAGPAYRWVEEPKALRLLRHWWRALGDWLADLQTANPAIFRLFAAALVVLLVAIFVHAGWVMFRTMRAAAGAPPEQSPPDAGARDATWYRREADRLAGAGHFAAALPFAFTALALTLDSRGVLRFHPSKTPKEIEREARVPADERERLRGLVGALYAHVFGGRPCGPEEYRRWLTLADMEWHAAAH